MIMKKKTGVKLGTWGIKEGCYVVLPILSQQQEIQLAINKLFGGDAWQHHSKK